MSTRTSTRSSPRPRPSPRPARPAAALPAAPKWTFLTNHAHVLICLARDSSLRIRDLALEVGITERTVQLILADLEEGGFLLKAKEGRRNLYTVVRNLPLRHPVEAHRKVSDLLKLVE